MNAPIRPLATCPLCMVPIEYWPENKPIQDCRRCLRPLALIPIINFKPRSYRIMSVFSLGKNMTAILALVALLSLPMSVIHLRVGVGAGGQAGVDRGALEAADGLAGLRSGVDFSWGIMKMDKTAKRSSYAKIAIGMGLLGLGLIGIGAQ